MKEREDIFLDMALEYMQKYKETPWWRFKKRAHLKSMWFSARECIFKYGNLKEKKPSNQRGLHI